MLIKSTNTMAMNPQMKNRALMNTSIGRSFCFMAFISDTGLSHRMGQGPYHAESPLENQGGASAVM